MEKGYSSTTRETGPGRSRMALYVTLGVLTAVMLAAAPASGYAAAYQFLQDVTDYVTGIDCQCSKTGPYVERHSGTIIAVKTETIEEGTSPKGVYRLVATTGQITIYENKEGGAEVLKISYTQTNVGWGFSPDDHRFVFHYIAAGKHTVELYDLRQRPAVKVKTIDKTQLAGDTSQIRFSPNGIYLFVISETHANNNAVTVVDTAGTVAHTSTFTHSSGAGLEGSTFRNATWGFSRDNHDRTLVLAWTTGSNSVRYRMVNLAAQQAHPDINISTLVSSFWRFSQCGDVMGLHLQEYGFAAPQHPHPVRILLFRTRDGHTLYNSSFSTIDYTVFAATSSYHTATIGGTTYNLMPNTAAEACAVVTDPGPELKSFTTEKLSVTGGGKVTGTVTISKPALHGGFLISLTSNRTAATVPASITIPAGSTQRTFEISTTAVTEDVLATIMARAEGTSIGRYLTIYPPRLKSMSFIPDSLVGGNNGMLRLELDGPAPTGGIAVPLEYTDTGLLELPANSWISAGSTTTTEYFETRGVAQPTNIVVQGTKGQTQSATLHLLPAELVSVRLGGQIFSPCLLRWADNAAVGGRAISYVARLNGEAPPDGGIFTFASGDPSVLTTPVMISIDSYERSVSFQIMTEAVPATRAVTFQVAYRGKIMEQGLTLVKAPVQYTVSDLTPPNTRWVEPIGLNETGQVLIYSSQHSAYYLWENGQYRTMHFPVPDGMRARINGFNDRGQFVGIVRESIFNREFSVWEDGVRHKLAIPSDVIPDHGNVAAINNRGQVAGNYATPDWNSVVVRWSGRQPEVLTRDSDALAKYYSFQVRDINEAGRVSASGSRRSGSPSFVTLYVAAAIDRGLSYYPRAEGMWPDASYINNHNTWTGGTMQIYKFIDGVYSMTIPPLLSDFQQYPSAINDREEIVGRAIFDFEEQGFSITQAVRATVEGSWPLECLVTDMGPDFTLNYALDINNAGQILAESRIRDENDNLHYFVWLLTPTDAPRANLQVQKSVTSIAAEAGEDILYTITVTNQGPDEAHEVRLSESIGFNQRLVSIETAAGVCNASEASISCALGSLAAGSSATISITTKAMVPGISNNSGVATSSTMETNPQSNRAKLKVTVLGGDPVTTAANIEAGETGEVDLSEAGMMMDVTEGSGTSGSVTATMYHEEPENSQDLPVVSVIAYGGEMEPDSVIVERYWTIQAENLEGLTYDLCINISGLHGIDPDFMVITKRSESSDAWVVYNSTLRTMDGMLYLCTEGLTHFSQIGIATELARIPDEDPGPGLPDLPGTVLLGYPDHGEITGPDFAGLYWHAAEPEIDAYGFQLASDELFTQILMDSVLTDTTITLHDLYFDTEYWWRVRAKNAAGWGPFSDARMFRTMDVGTERYLDLPDTFFIGQNYPNPFNPVTQIQFGLPTNAYVKLEIFNVIGQRVAILADGPVHSGWHVVSFDASRLSSGVYLYRLRAGDFQETRKMLLAK
jgi:uncharacterized repeat protein (TIGR01451 family)